MAGEGCEAEIRAYMLGDNKLAEKAGWDRELLAIEFEELQMALPEFGLDLDSTGFEPGEIDAIVHDFTDGRVNPADVVPELDAAQIVARRCLLRRSPGRGQLSRRARGLSLPSSPKRH